MSVSYNGLWKLLNEQGIMAKTMAYLNKLYVDTPVGADIFKVAGGGQNYVHGGTSLQEMMVPVIELTTNTRGVAYDYVDVVLTYYLVLADANDEKNKVCKPSCSNTYIIIP